jgi:MFS transporter, putative metabolite:H+ symporter
MGMFATGIAQPIVGGWIDKGRAEAVGRGLTGDAAEVAAGQATLGNLVVFPIVLSVALGVLWFWMRGRGHRPEA